MRDWAGPRLRLRLLAAVLAALPIASNAAEVAGITLADRTNVGTSELVLNGAGLRKKLVFRVYVAGLYLTEKRRSPVDVLTLGGPKRISITLLRNVSTRDLVVALDDGIRQNCSSAEQQALSRRLEELTATLLAIQQGKVGDVITFDWLPGAGTVLFFNGEARGETIEGDDVYCALLRVWVGDKPTSAGLKSALLGQAR